MQPDLSIVIVHYRTPALLLTCLQSIADHAEGVTLQVIVVDNASGDGTPDLVRQQFPYVHLIDSAINHYFSAGNNIGIRAATGRYILVMNPDMELRGAVLRQLVAALDAEPDPAMLGAISTALYFPDGRLQRNCSSAHSYHYLLINYTFLSKLLPHLARKLNDALWYADWDRMTDRAVEVLPGACICAPAMRWHELGGFDARMPMYFSDSAICDTWRTRGLRLRYVMTDGMIHHEGAATRDSVADIDKNIALPIVPRKRYRAFALRMYLRDLITYTRLRFGRLPALLLAVLLIPTWILQRLRA